MSPTSNPTPLMRQYLEWKGKYPDALLMFRLGDFYEMFYEDAVLASRELDLTLTTRDKNKENPVPMCGVPHHTLETYVGRLVEQGHKVAICDQVEDPRQAKGIVRREVTRVVTPGVILDLEQLDARRPNYLAAITVRPDGESGFGFAFADVSTGEFRVTVLDGPAALEAELARTRPRQVLVPPGHGPSVATLLSSPTPLVEEREVPGPSEGPAALLAELAAAANGTEADLDHLPADTLAPALMVLRYLADTIPSGLLPPLHLVAYRTSESMLLDEATLAHLEVFEPLMGTDKKATLLAAVDHTVTAMGGRAIRRALAYPFQNVEAITRRQDAVERLLEAGTRRKEIQRMLKQVGDLERLARRLAHAVANPKDLAALRRSLQLMPDLASLLEGLHHPESDLGRDLSLLDLGDDLLEDLADILAEALVEDPPATLKDGGLFRPGYHEELDRLVELSRGGKDNILAIEERERARTGISSLKVKYNKVFGYYIEVTKANLAQVPEDYTRKQTLANAERFVTPELAHYETMVLEAEDKRLALEQRLFSDLCANLAEHSDRILALAHAVAEVDLLCSFAELAGRNDYVRPKIVPEPVLEINEGRHPVVERMLPAGAFVPNDTSLDADSQQLLIITGPNMAGKSTIIRQVALITLLAHTGSFVPAADATVGITDRIFTRVGASDNLARGESTFMVEMKETARILEQATSSSLVILDEIGRGTSTFDGMSLAWAVAEHLHDRIRARTLFATHYHELCGMAELKPRVRNYAVLVKEWKDDIVFLHKLAPGGVNRSYGIKVAKLAGLPKTVIRRAEEILKLLEKNRRPADTAQLSLFDLVASKSKKRSRGSQSHVPHSPTAATDSLDPVGSQTSAAAETGPSRYGTAGSHPASGSAGRPGTQESHPALELLARTDPDTLTPKQALDLLYRLKKELDPSRTSD